MTDKLAVLLVIHGAIAMANILAMVYFRKYLYWDTNKTHIAILTLYSLAPVFNVLLLIVTMPEIYNIIKREEERFYD